jgi:WD40 repeat protein
LLAFLQFWKWVFPYLHDFVHENAPYSTYPAGKTGIFAWPWLKTHWQDSSISVKLCSSKYSDLITLLGSSLRELTLLPIVWGKGDCSVRVSFHNFTKSAGVPRHAWLQFIIVAAFMVLAILTSKVSAQSRAMDAVVQSNLPGIVETIALSPRGNLMATQSGNCVRIWAIPSGKLLRRIEGSSSPIAFSPNGGALAVRQGKDVVLFNTTSGDRLGSYQGPDDDEPLGMEFAEKSKVMAVSYYSKRILIWDLLSGRKVSELAGFAPFALSIDGSELTAATKSGILVSNLKARDEAGQPQQLKCSAISQDARFAICVEDSSLGVYDIKKHTRLASLEKVDSESSREFSFSPNGTFVLGPLEGGTGVWESKTGKHVRDLTPVAEPHDAVSYMATANNRVALSAKDGLAVLDIDTGKQVMELEVRKQTTTGVCFTDDDTIFHVDPTAGIAKWDLRSGRRVPMRPINNVPEWIFSAAITNKMAAVISADDVLVWVSGRDDAFQSLNVHNTISLHVAGIPNSSLLVFGLGERLALADEQATNRVVRAWNSETETMEGFAVDPAGRYVASAGFKRASIKLWDLRTGDEVVGATGLPSDASVLAFSRKGDMLAGEFSAAHMGEQIIIWSVPNLNRLASFPVGEGGAAGMAFDWEAGRLALLTNNGFVKFFDLPSGRLHKNLLAADCDTLAINQSANLLVCGGRYQNFIRLWRFRNAELLGDLYSIGTEDWVVQGPGGYYDYSQGALGSLSWTVAGQSLQSEKLLQSRRVQGLLTRATKSN